MEIIPKTHGHINLWLSANLVHVVASVTFEEYLPYESVLMELLVAWRPVLRCTRDLSGSVILVNVTRSA